MIKRDDLPTYRGYHILAVWTERKGDRNGWVYKVYFKGEWVDSFLRLEYAKQSIDEWVEAR